MLGDVQLSVFTKPWKSMPLAELAELVHALEVDGAELPVRPGFQVEPATVAAKLPEAVKHFAEHGVQIFDVAAEPVEGVLAACAECKVPLVRTMATIRKGENYLAAEERIRKELDALVPLLDKHGVTLGIQNHCDRNVANACGMRRIVEKYDPKHVAIVFDPAHTALQGEDPDLALDLVASHLRLVNLKNALWQRTNPDAPATEPAKWKHLWVGGREGLCPWPRVVAELKKRGYRGVICLCAEYSDEASVGKLIHADIEFAKSLLG